jgi:hypothetical protein
VSVEVGVCCFVCADGLCDFLVLVGSYADGSDMGVTPRGRGGRSRGQGKG